MKKTIYSLIILLMTVSSGYAESVWSHSFSLGFNIAKGNNDTTQLNTKLNGEKNKDDYKITYGLAANSGEDDDEQITNNYSAEAQYNRQYSAKNYWLVTASLDIDKEADLDRRLYIGPGLGYNVINEKDKSFDIEIGIAYLSTKYDSVAEEDDLGYRIAQNFTKDLSANASLWQKAEFLGNSDDGDAYVFKAEIGVEANLVSGFNVKSYVENTLNNAPAPGKKKNDLAFVTMLVYKF
jgi:putative salt-induced outer membrane protein YdiY